MATGSLARMVPRLRAAELVALASAPDAELLEHFSTRRDEAAFEMLVRRHGPMVFAVCWRVLHHTQDAEDAFQATFVVLAHKARTRPPRGNLAAWLHAVAHKTALKARQRVARRLEVEKCAPIRTSEEMHPDTNGNEVEPLLDQELAALPDHYRLPIIMCDLEDRPRTEVASALGCSEGTLSSRLTRGRRLLAERLTRRGVHLSLAAGTTIFTGRSIVLAEPLVRATIPVALSFVESCSPAGRLDRTSGANGAMGAVSPRVAELATGVLKSMFLKKLRTVALSALAVAGAALALVGVTYQGQAAPVPTIAPVPAEEKKPPEPLGDIQGRLLMNRKVIRDMKCDMDQFDRIMDLLEVAEKKSQQKTNEALNRLNFNAGGAPPTPEMIKKMIQDAHEAGDKEFRAAVAQVWTDILTPAQRKRFREIDLQARGHEAFTTPGVIRALDITAKQKEQFEANIKRVEEDIIQGFQKPQSAPLPVGAPPDYREPHIPTARAEGMKRALALLTDDQRTTWKKLTGEPFTHPLPLPTVGLPDHIGFGNDGIGFANDLPAQPAKPPVNPGK